MDGVVDEGNTHGITCLSHCSAIKYKIDYCLINVKEIIHNRIDR